LDSRNCGSGCPGALGKNDPGLLVKKSPLG
jgi:hypothetical protein